MITATEPSITVEDLPDEKQNVPCDMLWLGKPCGSPAAGRYRVVCECAIVKPAFICERCLRAVRAGWVTCTAMCHVIRELGPL